MGFIGVKQWLYRDNGKENANYYLHIQKYLRSSSFHFSSSQHSPQYVIVASISFSMIPTLNLNPKP